MHLQSHQDLNANAKYIGLSHLDTSAHLWPVIGYTVDILFLRSRNSCFLASFGNMFRPSTFGPNKSEQNRCSRNRRC